MTRITDEQLVQHVRKILDRGTDALPEEATNRLRRARLAALDTASAKGQRWGVPRLLTAGGLATVAIMAVVVSLWSDVRRQDIPLRQPDEVEILTAQEHLELYEDLDFYHWLAVGEERAQGVER